VWSIEGCPYLPVIRQRLARALASLGRDDIDIRLRLIRTQAEAEERRFEQLTAAVRTAQRA
jgi:hypothetical protein